MENIHIWYIYIYIYYMCVICICKYIYIYIYCIWYIWSQQRWTAISCLKVICLTNVKKRSWPNLLWGRRLNHSSHSLATSTCSGQGAMELSNHQQWALHRMTCEHWICFILKFLKVGIITPKSSIINRIFINPPVPPFQETICALPAVGYLSPRNSCDGIFEKISRDRLSPPLGHPVQSKHIATEISQQEIPTEWNKTKVYYLVMTNIWKITMFNR